MPPFVFGKIATSENFTDRIVECKHLEANFKNLVNTIIISPRRWGKSSLVERACMSLKDDKEYAIVRMDAFNCRTEEDFYKTFSK
ncbi:MAG: ATPase, partial [Bacteroidales bacterium]|nr:ATPase [Bacteroidales bacterium]